MLTRRSSDTIDVHDEIANQVLATQIVTIPAIILSALICKVIDRKNTITMGFLFCLAIGIVPSIRREGLIVSSAFINFFLFFSLSTAKIYVIEAFPTKLRDYLLAFLFCLAKFGDAFTPLICNLLLKVYSFGPMVLTNLLCVIGFISSYCLPFDTLGYLTE